MATLNPIMDDADLGKVGGVPPNPKSDFPWRSPEWMRTSLNQPTSANLPSVNITHPAITPGYNRADETPRSESSDAIIARLKRQFEKAGMSPAVAAEKAMYLPDVTEKHRDEQRRKGLAA